MKSLRQRITESANTAGVPITSLGAEQERMLLIKFFDALTIPKRGCWPIWQNGIPPKCSFMVSNAYEHIFHILLRHSAKEINLLFENSQELGLFTLSSPHDFLKLIGESDIFV
jgi:hypothetical protein